MGIAEWIKNALSRNKEKKERYNEIDTEHRLNDTYHERKKNSNERELERYHKEARNDRISRELESWRKRDRKDFWHGKKVYEQKALFTGHKSLLKQKNIFKGKRMKKKD